MEALQAIFTVLCTSFLSACGAYVAVKVALAELRADHDNLKENFEHHIRRNHEWHEKMEKRIHTIEMKN